MNEAELLSVFNNLLHQFNKLNSDLLILSKDKKVLKKLAKRIYTITHHDGILEITKSKKFKPLKKIHKFQESDIAEFLNTLKKDLKLCTSITKEMRAELIVELDLLINPTINERLPAELLVNIFSYLDPAQKAIASLVCSNWNATVKDDLLWRDYLLEEAPYLDKPAVNLLRLSHQSLFDMSSNILSESDCFMIFKEGDFDDPFQSVSLNQENLLTEAAFSSLTDLNNHAAFMSGGGLPFIIKFDVSLEQLKKWQETQNLGEILLHVKSLDTQDVVFRDDQFHPENHHDAFRQ